MYLFSVVFFFPSSKILVHVKSVNGVRPSTARRIRLLSKDFPKPRIAETTVNNKKKDVVFHRRGEGVGRGSAAGVAFESFQSLESCHHVDATSADHQNDATECRDADVCSASIIFVSSFFPPSYLAFVFCSSNKRGVLKNVSWWLGDEKGGTLFTSNVFAENRVYLVFLNILFFPRSGRC